MMDSSFDHGSSKLGLSEPAPEVSVVVIGRNEGQRLARCLDSVRVADWGALRHQLIYVDSGSIDNSVALAQQRGAEVLLLNDAAPCAAKARNMGWRHAQGEFVLFLDGDTELHPAFVLKAIEALNRDEPSVDRKNSKDSKDSSSASRVCAVWGHRRESKPEQSIYTRVLDLDWIYPTGLSLYFGGDVLVRRAALQDVGGFDPMLKAGEEPELGARLRASGWTILHIDARMTQHDLAVRSIRAYCLRAYRSGMAYAEVAQRMRQQGKPLWQYEARRDLVHGALLLASPLLLGAAWAWSAWAALGLALLAVALVVRTGFRSAWKAPGRYGLLALYALHSHVQKVPSLFGQLAWWRMRLGKGQSVLVEYKAPSGLATRGHGAQRSRLFKGLLAKALVPCAALWRYLVIDRWMRVWSLARLSATIGREVSASNVLLGPVEVHGTGNVRIGSDALLYPGIHLETQGDGEIVIGDGVVLSRGVHVVAYRRVVIGDRVMVGEYSSLRDANHRRSLVSIRHSGHEAAPIEVGRNVWIGRGVAVLKGAMLGENCVVAANSVVTKSVPACAVVAGAPAKPVGADAGLRSGVPTVPTPRSGPFTVSA